MPKKAPQPWDPFAPFLSSNPLLIQNPATNLMASRRSNRQAAPQVDPTTYVKAPPGMGIDLNQNWRPMPFPPSPARSVRDPETGYTLVTQPGGPVKFFDANHQLRSADAYQQAKHAVLARRAAQGRADLSIDPKSDLFQDARKFGGIVKRIPMPSFGGERVIFNTSGANRIGYYGTGWFPGRRIAPPKAAEAPAENAPITNVWDTNVSDSLQQYQSFTKPLATGARNLMEAIALPMMPNPTNPRFI